MSQPATHTDSLVSLRLAETKRKAGFFWKPFGKRCWEAKVLGTSLRMYEDGGKTLKELVRC